MATTEEIERRVEEADAARSAKRAAAAKRVGELGRLRAEAAEKLGNIERELGDVVAASSDVIGVDELAKFTDMPAADLTQLLDGRRTTRSKRKRSTASTSTTNSDATQAPSASEKTASPELAEVRAAAANSSTQLPMSVT